MDKLKKPQTVDEYISNAPKDIQGRLKELRKTIRSAAPQAEEKISYGMPYYGFNGRLVYFAYAKNHVGLYIMTPTIETFKKELKDYSTSKATIRFPNDQKLPLGLIKKMVSWRAKLNEDRR